MQALRDYASSLGIQILEISVRGGTPAEEVYRRLGFVECGRVPDGLLNPGGEPPLYDEVYFWMPVGRSDIAPVEAPAQGAG